MSLWTSSVICLLLLQTVHSQAQQAQADNMPLAIEEVARPSESLPRPLVFAKKDWSLNRAYSDVFNILSNPNTCSSFYGGPRAATTVLNSFVTFVKSEPLLREVSFQMSGKLTLIRKPAAGVFYRIFDRMIVNSDGSFYQRRQDAMRKIPSNVGSFGPGTRPARALILLHELGHLIQGENGSWLIPDDGFNFQQSTANTLHVQQVCHAELDKLK
jgi:hypothetical protein